MVKVDYSRDVLLNPHGMSLLKNFYMRPWDTSPQDVYARAATAFADDEAHAQRMYNYFSMQWLGASSPILSNAPDPRDKRLKGLPIACFLGTVPDDIEGQYLAADERKRLSVLGGGVAEHVLIRGVDDKAAGPIPWVGTANGDVKYYHQGGTRRGSIAEYLWYTHPDSVEFIGIRNPNGGDSTRKCLDIHTSITFDYELLELAKSGGDVELRCPHSGELFDTIPARDMWQRMVNERYLRGEPFMCNVEEMNNALHPVLKAAGYKVHGSNLCTEIALVTADDMSAVCCLASPNAYYFEEWRDTPMIRDLVRYLDNVLTYTYNKLPDALWRIKRGIEMMRDIGIGLMGWHSLLQRKMIPFESGGVNSAAQWAFIIQDHIWKEAEAESLALGAERGEAPAMKGTGRRNAHLIAIAPTANNSIINNCSPATEPYLTNYYTQRTRAGTVVHKNPELDKLILNKIDKGEITASYDEVWDAIKADNGILDNIEDDWFSEHELAVFRCFKQIDMTHVIDQARIRQSRIDQAQSTNLYFAAGAHVAYVNGMHMRAFDRDPQLPGVPLKTLYYLRTTTHAKADNVGKAVVREVIKDYESQECTSCHG